MNDREQNNQQLLNELKSRIEVADVTPELRAQATQMVFGVGNPNAQIVLIGEAPGKQEDLRGEPFVGASGKFLDEMLSGIGMERESIYITNIVKYRPPDNRDPLLEEKKAFLPYLQAQLEIIQPKLVVTLGRHSGMCFLPDLQISRDHGKPKRIKLKTHAVEGDETATIELVILPLYHPAAALYNGGMRQTLMEDFMLIPAIINKMEVGK